MSAIAIGCGQAVQHGVVLVPQPLDGPDAVCTVGRLPVAAYLVQGVGNHNGGSRHGVAADAVAPTVGVGGAVPVGCGAGVAYEEPDGHTHLGRHAAPERRVDAVGYALDGHHGRVGTHL